MLDFVFIGAQKAGTTAVHHLLMQVPALALPDDKELPVFHIDREDAEVQAMLRRGFSSAHAGLRGKVTPHYLGSTGTARRLHDHNRSMTVAAVLREPVARMQSQYSMNVALGIEDRSFDEVVASALVDRERSGPLRENQTYLRRSSYGRSLWPYSRLFGERLILFPFSMLVEDAPTFVAHVAACLGVHPPGQLDSDVPRNESRQGGVRFREMKHYLPGAARAWEKLPQPVRSRLGPWLDARTRAGGGIPPPSDTFALDEAQVSGLRDHFGREAELLASLDATFIGGADQIAREIRPSLGPNRGN